MVPRYTKCVSDTLEGSLGLPSPYLSLVSGADDDDDGLRLYDLNIANMPPLLLLLLLSAGSCTGGGGEAGAGAVSHDAGWGGGDLRRSTYAKRAKSGRAFFTKNMRAAVSRCVYGMASFLSV
jgi:hypothetical protein